MSRQVYIEHAPWSPFVREGMVWKNEFGPVDQEVQGTYKLFPAQMCNGLAVPESSTGEMVLRPVIAAGGARPNVMY